MEHGKTVLLNEVMDLAEKVGYLASFIESPENKSLTEMLYPQMRQTLGRLSAIEKAKYTANGALRALRGFFPL